MARETTLIFSVKDNYSASLVKMIQHQREMEASGKSLQQRLGELSNTKVNLKVDLSRAKQELREAQKSLDGTNSSVERLENAEVNLQNIQDQLRLVSGEAKKVTKELDNANSAISKTQNRAGQSMLSSSGSSSLLSKVGQAGLTKMIGDVASEAGNVFIKSAFGGEAATMLSSTISGAASGMAMGSFLGPVGTAVGGIVGGAVGAVSGGLKNYEARDDAFKAVVQEQVQNALDEQSASLTNGTSVFSQRENAQLAFSKILNSENEARGLLTGLQDYANVTPFQFEDLTGIARTLLTYGYTTGEIQTGEGLKEGKSTLINAIGDAGAALSLSTGDMNAVATGLGRMKSSGKATLEYINLLQERGIDAIGYLQHGMEFNNKSEVYSAISKSEINGELAAEIITDHMADAYSGSMQDLSETYSGLVSTYEGLTNNLDAAMGEGYTEAMKSHLEEQNTFLQNGGLEEDYKLIGEWRASLEGEKMKLERDILSAVKGGEVSDALGEEARTSILKMREEYEKAATNGDGAAMGKVLARARILAQSEYEASDGAQILKESQISLIESVRNDKAMKDEYWNTGYVLGQEFSKGMSAATQYDAYSAIYGIVDTFYKDSPEMKAAALEHYDGLLEQGVPYGQASYQTGLWIEEQAKGNNHAYGLNYVPYDNYPAMLHEGERVLTASEARRGNTPDVSINVYGMTVREEADINKIAQVFCDKLKKANAVYMPV